jgi:hypothetical protein
MSRLNTIPIATFLLLLITCWPESTLSFAPVSSAYLFQQQRTKTTTATELGVWWFGGATEESTEDDDSCELVAVRIERTSANSRRIHGEIVTPTPLRDVWAILTDYDRLAIHVPNLVESKIVSSSSGPDEQGQGQYRCRLFQKGAQKIIGFEFGASVTMDMQEYMPVPGLEHLIRFKCHDSFFFNEFDGEWKARQQTNNESGEIKTVLSYVVDVRPKGPVPVGALEWRIREDVPTNLRAVKKAAMEGGYEGVMAARRSNSRNSPSLAIGAKNKADRLARVINNIWEKEETMAAYLGDPSS